MASYHDAYLFKPEQFMQVMLPYLETLNQVDAGYAALRTAAIALFDRSAQVRYLAATYGDWEREGLLDGAPADRPRGFHDIAFWFTVVLYGQLLSRPHTLGLAGKWEMLANGLGQFGWDPQDITLLIRGRKFIELAQAQPGQTRLGYWHHLYPRAKNGYAGWMNLSDVQRLKGLLAAASPKIQAATADASGFYDDLQRSYRMAMQMLASAEENQAGLCMIMTG